jgi:hypothetical protein
MTSFIVTVDVPEDRHDDIMNEIKQLGVQIVVASDNKTS